MLLGLEREWSNKSAGIRTFTLTSLIGAAAMSFESTILLALGGGLVILQSALLGIRGLLKTTVDSESSTTSLSLTTSTSLLVAYFAGILVAAGRVLVGVTIAIIASFLLVLRRELHDFASQLSKDEVRSAAEFAIIAFVIYPLLPRGSYGPWNAIEPRTIWLLVIAVGGVGFVNYILMQRYGSRGIAITGFFGGLVNSTAVIGEIANRAQQNVQIESLAVGAILMADAAMAVRNFVIVATFIPRSAVTIGLPLGLIAVTGVLLAITSSDWDEDLELDFDSPFSTTSALKFGLLFLVVLLVSAGAQEIFGTTGFLITSFLSGIISSGTTTTTAISLISTGSITHSVAAAGVLAGTVASILVKILLAVSINRSLLQPIAVRSIALVGIGVAGGSVAIGLV
jgi:uncharacterized membrane protein (DUF4010 family)